jgi:hypothetical protein
VDLDEPLRVEVLSEQLAHSGLDPENGLVGWCLDFLSASRREGSESLDRSRSTYPQIHDSVVETRWQADSRELDIFRLHLRFIVS